MNMKKWRVTMKDKAMTEIKDKKHYSDCKVNGYEDSEGEIKYAEEKDCSCGGYKYNQMLGK